MSWTPTEPRSKEGTTISAERVLAIGGLDPSGGSGIGRDAATLAQAGATPLLVATAITVQEDGGVARIEPVAGDVVAAGIAVAMRRGVGAVKLGMLHRLEVVEAVAEGIAGAGVPVVLDPVLSASSGDALSDPGLERALSRLQAWTTVVTPNLDEARRLLGDPALDAPSAARALVDAGWSAALVTGGDRDGEEAIDELATPSWSRTLGAPRVSGRSPRGTGCAFASLIAAGLAKGDDLETACRTAKGQLRRMILDAHEGLLGSGVRTVWPYAGHPFE